MALTDEDRKIIELKYLCKRFRHMSPADALLHGKLLLLKIHVITGWTIPTGDLQTILVDQFVKILLEKYPDMNPEEIEYAFRTSGTTVEDWGKNMNLNLLDKVLLPYLNERYRISEMERQLAYKKKPQDKPVPKWQIELEYALCLLKKANKLPCQVKITA